ncbi:MAG: ATP-binding cassette domain-containing protein [Bacteroidales bacterium]|nr:ATP-binding cassette domain-containing protein [Bacteroidales bacterium]
MEIFKAVNIEKRYNNHLALDNLTLSVPEGSIYGLLGPNGAGKTTLIRIINQITAPDKGELFFKNRKFRSDDVMQIGYLPEERGLYRKMKVGEQALYLCRLKGVKKGDALQKLKYWFEKFEISAWWNKKVEELSKGMQQKVQFIVTILHEPKLLIFDEPFSGFDPINTDLLKKEILNLKTKGATVIFSTHDMGSVEELCDRITLINKSKSILEGNIKEIRDTYKSNIFEAGFRGDATKLGEILGEGFEITGLQSQEEMHYAKIKVSENKEKNLLLSRLIPYFEITAFNEVLPRMNEIFIKAVKEAGKNQQNEPNTWEKLH